MKRVLAVASTVGVVVTLAAPALTTPARAGMTPVSRMETVNAVNRQPVQRAKGGGGGHKPGGGGTGSGSNNLSYLGGVGGVGVELTPKVYVVFWGKGWSTD